MADRFAPPDWLKQISDARPSGEDLTADADFLRIRREGPGEPDRFVLQPGEDGKSTNVLVPGEPPNYRELEDLCTSILAGRSHDLRICLWYTASALRNSGLEGFARGLSLTAAVCERFWASCFPLPSDDPSAKYLPRSGELAALSVPIAKDKTFRFLRALRETPFVVAPSGGKVSLATVYQVGGKMKIPEGVEPPTAAYIKFVMDDAPVDVLVAALDVIKHCEACLESLKKKFEAESAEPPNFKDLGEMLADMRRQVEPEVKAKQAAASGVAAPTEAAPSAAPGPAAAATGPVTIQRVAEFPTQLTSLSQVEKALDLVLRFYEAGEERQASPVPIVIAAAKALIGKNYVELSRRITSENLRSFKVIAGIPDDS